MTTYNTLPNLPPKEWYDETGELPKNLSQTLWKQWNLLPLASFFHSPWFADILSLYNYIHVA